MLGPLFAASALAGTALAQSSAAFTPLAAKHFEYDNLVSAQSLLALQLRLNDASCRNTETAAVLRRRSQTTFSLASRRVLLHGLTLPSPGLDL